MRTTLAIDDDVLAAAKAMAAQQNRTLGEVISDLARKSLETMRPRSSRNGIPQLGLRADTVVTSEVVGDLRDNSELTNLPIRAAKKVIRSSSC